jgi:hypothetical protein
VVASGSSSLTSYSGFTSDASGNVVATSVGTTAGGVAGKLAVTQGTAASIGITAIGITAPASVTSYNLVLPGAAGSGFLKWTNAANVVTAVFDPGPALGAATATSLLATGIVDGAAPVTTTTACTSGAHCTLGGTYKSGYTLNQHATASTATFYDLPPVANTVVGMQYCVYNDIVSGTGASETGVITITPAATAYLVKKGVIGVQGHTATSAGAAGDGVCLVAVDTTHWKLIAAEGSTWILTP